MEWWQILLIIVMAEIGLNFVGLIGWAIHKGDDIYDTSDFFELTLLLPQELKNETYMNWFGCWLSFIFLFLLFPIVYIIKIIYWLCHI